MREIGGETITEIDSGGGEHAPGEHESLGDAWLRIKMRSEIILKACGNAKRSGRASLA